MSAQRVILLAKAARRAEDGSGQRIRKQAKVPISAIAEAVGSKIPTVSRWENGQRRPRGEPAIRWAALLDDMEREQKRTAQKA